MDEQKIKNDTKMSETGNDSQDNVVSREDDTQSAVVPEAAVGGEVMQKKSGALSKMVIAGVMLALVGVIAWFAFMNQDEKEIDLTVPNSTATEMNFDDVPEVVASVNGETISRDEYVEAYSQVSNMVVQQGLDPQDPAIQTEIQKQAIERLVNTAVLAQAAVAAGVTVDDARVAQEFGNLETSFGGAEALAAELENAEITREELEGDITSQLQIDSFIQDSAEWADEFTVTQAEKQEFYDEIAAQSPDIPAFADVEAQIEQQLLAEKQQAATQALIERLLAEATVETYLTVETE